MIYRGVPYPLCFFCFTSGDTGSLVWGGVVFCDVFISRCFVSIVLVLVVYSIFSCSYMSGVLF